MIQKIIGRDQSFEITKAAADKLRARGIKSLNADILFGLPHQTRERISESVQKLLTLSPDRIALYGYAHVPWMARRQVMIPSDTLPGPEDRLKLFEAARDLFVWDGYDEIGIDHFARPDDGLSVAKKTGKLRRNFQGYTDDTAPVLIGLGASAISRFPQGYAQNAPGTSDYVKAVRAKRFSTVRGHVFKGEDLMRARMIEALMCDFRVDAEEIRRDYAVPKVALQAIFARVSSEFGDMVRIDDSGLTVPVEARPLTRMIARSFDAYDLAKAGHSPAV
jgi:oxygen-independent coproporphyrinogen-3 oxidase